MKTKLSIVILLLLGFSGVYSQSSKQKLNHAKKEASEERKRSFGGQQTENDLKDDKGDLPASQKNKVGDGVRESEQSHDNQSDNSSTQMVKSNQDQSSPTGSADSTKGRRNDTPLVIQRTTSESGSPAILSKNNGEGRDGTNNVQRSSLNMAGAKIKGNMNLDRKNKNENNIDTDSLTPKRQEQLPAGSQYKDQNSPGKNPGAARSKKVQPGTSSSGTVSGGSKKSSKRKAST